MSLKFAVIGSGPAGFTVAKMILNHIPKSFVDIIDRNPHPYGLIRTGIAPDH
jgi:NADPH-dependent glutamate synthase beta subunit-like oxidoreductase